MKDDTRCISLLKEFESKSSMDTEFLEKVHELLLEQSEYVFDELFYDTPLEIGKTLSKKERLSRSLDEEKVYIYIH
jgi:hypothetical protein